MTAPVHLSDEQAQRWIEGLLPAAAPVEAHLAGCPECRGLVEGYRALSRALEGLPGAEPPPDFTAGVLERIETRERHAAWERRLAAAILGAAVAAAAGFAAAAGESAWAPAVSGWFGGLIGAGDALRIGAAVLAPVVAALRIPVAVACAALALPLFYAIARLSPPRPKEVALRG